MFKWDIPIDEADVIKVLVMTESHLGEGSRRYTAGSVTEERTTAVSGGASTTARSVEGAAVTAPETTGPERWKLESVSSVRREFKSAAGEKRLTGASLDPRPDCVCALVVKYYRWSLIIITHVSKIVISNVWRGFNKQKNVWCDFFFFFLVNKVWCDWCINLNIKYLRLECIPEAWERRRRRERRKMDIEEAIDGSSDFKSSWRRRLWSSFLIFSLFWGFSLYREKKLVSFFFFRVYKKFKIERVKLRGNIYQQIPRGTW